MGKADVVRSWQTRATIIVAALGVLAPVVRADESTEQAQECPDVSGDGVVNVPDLLQMLSAFGCTGIDCCSGCDINQDDRVNVIDILGLLSWFNVICEPAPEPPYAEAMNASAADPYTPLVAIATTITVEGDLDLITDSLEPRMHFDEGFASAVASSLGSPGDGSTVEPEVVAVDDLLESDVLGTFDVVFHLLLPQSLRSTGSSMVTAMQESGQQIEIPMGISNQTFVADAASIVPPTITPAVVDCEGAWIASNDCSEPCGPNGVRDQSYVVFRAAQNGGLDCANAETVPSPRPCNTHVQCPVDCSGDWGEWGACSLPCGGGNSTRSYAVLQEPQHGGAECPEQDTSQSVACNTEPCPPPPPQPTDCVGSWSGYGECSHSCGPNGLHQRTYAISQIASNGGVPCPVEAGDVESQSCNTGIPCPIDCEGEWSDFGPCSAVCGPGTMARVFHVTVEAQHGGDCPEEGTNQTEACDNLCPTGLEERDIEPGPVSLPISGSIELATLIKVPLDQAHLRGSAVPVARSYNGNNWEGVMPSPIAFECTQTQPVACSANLAAGFVYQLRMYNGSAYVSQDPSHIASRFLTLSTFGPKLDEISTLGGSTVEETDANIEDWILAQMEMEPSLHRVYNRQRWNPISFGKPQTMMRPPCQEGSSWVEFAFSKFDQGKPVDVSLNADGSYSLSIEGVIRTVVESTKDIREDIEWSCYKRGFRVPLDSSSVTTEATTQACQERCLSTDGCGYFSFNEATGDCFFHPSSSVGRAGHGGTWRTGPADCSPTIYQYPSTEPVEGLMNMGSSCWGQCGRHGSCPDRCGENGFCCRFGRDLNGCVTTDPSASSHRCIPDPSMPAPPPAPAPRLQPNMTYVLCFVNEYVGGDVSLLLPGTSVPDYAWQVSSCQRPMANQIIIGNPEVNLTVPDMFITQQLENIDLVPITVSGVRNSFSLRNIVDSCELPPNPTVFIFHSEKYYRHEARVELVDNTVENPYIERRMVYQTDRTFIPSLTPTWCSAAKKAFTNAEGCVRQSSCMRPQWSDGTISLDAELMQQLYHRSQKFVYYLTELPEVGQSDSPCSQPSRWMKTSGDCDVDTPLDEATLASISAALTSNTLLETPFITDIEAVDGGDCTTEANGVSAAGAKLTLNGICYEHVHRDTYSVYDMAYWVERNPGRTNAGYNPLTRLAADGVFELPLTVVCPDRSCWPTRFSNRNPTPLTRKLGTLGEEVEFRTLPTTIQKPWLAELAGVEDISVDPGVSESCGSIGEVANDPAYGHKYGGRYGYQQKPSYWPRDMLWLNAVFHAEDQLRQRVAWALSQIYVVSEVGHPGGEGGYSQYYDIFVRNAFGNFRNLIKEIAYSYPMADMLTFINSKSAAASGDFADENFARECIQLFTVGTEHLNLDGTPVLDDTGNHVPTYGVKDVASFARTWTGFVRPGGLRTNKLGAADTLVINPNWRDASPKMDLYDGFIGDGYPACVDLPKRAFLRKGFEYAYRGDTVEHLDMLKDDAGVVSFLTLEDPSSALYQLLCDPTDGISACAFPTHVTLAQSLACTGFECGIDRAPLIKVVAGTGSVGFYEAVDFACTKFPFFNDGQFVKYGAPFLNTMSCSDPRNAGAAPLCCSDDSTDGTGTARCQYHRERVTYHTALQRCESQGGGQDVCQGNAAVSGWGSCHPFSQWRFSTWMGRPCSTQAQVQRDGRVSVVHAGDLVDNSALGSRIDPESVAEVLQVGSKSVFDVLWSDDAYPLVETDCSSSCTIFEDTCLCDVEATSSAVFTDSEHIPTASEVEGLHVGSLDPMAHDEGEYLRCESSLCEASEVTVWSRRRRMHEALQLEIEEINVALDKPTDTSSNLGNSQDAWIVDGRTESGLYHSACSGEQWVQVDLQNVTNIDSVKIFHRTDCCGGRINGAAILISDTPDFSTGTQCGSALSWVNGYTVNECLGIAGRYVTVRQEGQCLQVVEMEVYAEAILTSDGYVYAPELYSFVSTSDDLVLDESTIFEVQIGNTSRFYKNQEFRVTLDDFSFRNPPTFMDFEHPTLRQAELETDAVFDHLTTHPSTAPFVCKKLIQRLTTSNPSPRYVLEVVTAFRSGQYGGRVYSGQYGDLGATMAAIFMDREARDSTLDIDPAAGKIREPLLKILHAMRSLEFVPNNDVEFEMPHLDTIIGMQAFKSPSVFNFYLPDYTPSGPASKALLYAPEAEILTTPFVIGYMNGMTSLVDNGLSNCDRGFGAGAPSPAPHLYMASNCHAGRQAKRMTSNGLLTYEYQNRAGDVVSELALLLTGGREPQAIRDYWDDSQTPRYNVALNKPTTASTQWDSNHGPEEIVDGSTEDSSMFHSQCRGEQWAQVDLEEEVAIDSIRIFHRTSCCSDRINGAIVLISNTSDSSTGTQCAADLIYTGTPSSTLSCPGTTGRYVTVQLEGTCLQIKELQVIALGGDGGVGEARCRNSTTYYSLRPNLSCGNCDSAQPSYGPNGERWQAATRSDVTDCEATCSANSECGGFNYVEAQSRCYFRNNDMMCDQSTDAGRDCHIKTFATGDQSICGAVTDLDDDAACAAAGCTYTSALELAHPVPSPADMLPLLIKLFTFSAEYTATNLNILREHPRPALPEIPTQNRPYKAIVVLFLEGGADSFNMLIPHSGCTRDMYAEYAEIRSNIALPLANILPMDLHEESTEQICTTFGTHPALGMVKTLWDAGQASWFANIGSLVEPTTRDQFVAKSVDLPPHLFGHDSQQRQAQSVHAQNTGASGVLGRVVEALTAQDSPYRSKVYSMYGIRKLVEGNTQPTVIGGGGVVRFGQYEEMRAVLGGMTDRESDSIFADTYAGILQTSLESTERLGAQTAAVNLLGDYSGGTGMQNVARIMALDHSVHESERDVFMVGIRTFDAHQNPPHMDINMHLSNINADLVALHTDLVHLGLWESTTIVTISDFGRTITSNGIGTDHGWGGNNFIAGGAVKGGRIHGHFPDDLNPATSELEVGRGRGVFVPTTPWEGMWHGLAQWFGVEEDRIHDVVPNAANFPDSALFTADELFN